MAKIISQDTFDDVVKENIVDFAMSADEAKQETIKQFEAQGINLANIIKDLAINEETGKPILHEIIDCLKQYIGEKSTDTQKLLEYVRTLEQECNKSLPHRVLAGKNGAHDALITLLELELTGTPSKPNVEVVEACLRAVNSLTSKQPDLFDAEALAVVIKLLAVESESVRSLTLTWMQKACIMHETNRQNIVNAGLVKRLKPFVSSGQSIRILSDVLAVFRYLVLDDDVRVEFSQAHEHARQIASETIVQLTKLLAEYDDITVLGDLMLTIGALAVRQEFCTTIEDAGGLELVFKIMAAHTSDVRLTREALKLVRALAGNDTVKVHIVQQGFPPILKEALETHMNNENLVGAALACVSTLTLRVKDNSIAFFATGVAETIADAMQKHSKNKIVIRNGAWAIRNMVSRSRDQCETWLSYGVEEMLNNAMTEHPSIQQDVKAALRDLGCKVDLKEEWTGVAEKKILNIK